VPARLRTSLRARFALILSTLIAALLILVAGTLVTYRVIDQRELVETNARAYAETTRTKLCEVWKLYYSSGSYKFSEIVRETMKLNPDLHRLLILSVSGEVLYDSFESAETTLLAIRPVRRLEDPELIAGAAKPELWSKYDRYPNLGEVLLIGAPYFEEWGRHPYSVLYVFTYDKMQERILESLRGALGVMLVAMIVAAVVSFWLAGRVAGPILQLTNDVRLFSEGRDHVIRPITTGDEIQVLAETFTQMAGRIRQQVEKLEQANKDLSTLDRMKTDLLANVSHELRTPLSAIRGYVEFIQEGQLGPISEPQRKGLDVCLRNAERLTKTINMLLDFSRMELGRVSIRPAPFQLGRLIAQVVGGIESDAKKRRIKLEMDVERELKPVDADRDRITQVLENLLTNALKFTPDGGRVGIRATMVDERRRVEVSIWDTGPGIAPEERARVFDKFYQSDATATRKHGGIGLGLAIVKSILDAHQAPITVDANPAGGTVFRFSLQGVEARTESGVFTGLLSSGEGSGEILAIDDDNDFLSIITETLGKQGFAVRTARSAAVGLQMAQERTPKLILLDIRLPDRDGLDLLHSLKETPSTKNVPILVCSVVDERIEGLRLGAVEYLVKPIDRGRLVEAAMRALGRTPSSISGRFDISPRILVVDDEEEVCQLLGRALRVNGFKVDMAKNGTEAIESALARRPDLVLLDLVLPDISGWDVVRRLRASGGKPVPILVLSGHSSPGDEDEARRLGVNALLAKPVDMNRILERIKELLSSAS